MSKQTQICRVCGVELTRENWAPSYLKRNYRLCKNCSVEKYRQWKKANPEKTKAQQIRSDRKRGKRPMSENKECAAFLGVYVAEGVLGSVFKNVQRMPYGNPGFDFICGKGYRIDVKGACLGKTQNKWQFGIKHNTIADYFLCLAFDNRKDLNPLHVWLIPGDVVNSQICVGIRPTTISKWDQYALDISKVSTCCNTLKGIEPKIPETWKP